jgi:flagellar protein FlaG
MIDTNNIIAVKPVPVMQEVAPTVNTEKITAETKSQYKPSTEQVQNEKERKSEKKIDPKLAEQIVHQLNDNLKIFNTRIAFSIDDKTKKTIVKIIDEDKNEVIRQVPPDYLLKISQRISELLGIMVDEKA